MNVVGVFAESVRRKKTVLKERRWCGGKRKQAKVGDRQRGGGKKSDKKLKVDRIFIAKLHQKSRCRVRKGEEIFLI